MVQPLLVFVSNLERPPPGTFPSPTSGRCRPGPQAAGVV